MKAAPRWRRFVLQSRWLRLGFFALFASAIIAIFLPEATRVIALRAFCVGFGLLLLCLTTPLVLDGLAAALKRDILTAIWLAALAAALAFAAVQSIRAALRLAG